VLTLNGAGVPPTSYNGFTPITNQQLKIQFFSGNWQISINGIYYGNALATTSICPIGNTWTSTPELTIIGTTGIN